MQRCILFPLFFLDIGSPNVCVEIEPKHVTKYLKMSLTYNIIEWQAKQPFIILERNGLEFSQVQHKNYILILQYLKTLLFCFSEYM